MSQKKVDLHKEQKKNREQIAKKEHRKHVLEGTVGVLIAVAIVGWLGYSVYIRAEESAASTVTETSLDVTSLDDYLNSIGETEE